MATPPTQAPAQGNAMNAPAPVAVPNAKNQTTPVPVSTSSTTVNSQGMTAAQMSAVGAAGTATPAAASPGVSPTPAQTIQQSQAQPGVLTTGASTGSGTASPGQLPAPQTQFQAVTEQNVNAQGQQVDAAGLAEQQKEAANQAALNATQANLEASRQAQGLDPVTGTPITSFFNSSTGQWQPTPPKPSAPPTITPVLDANGAAIIQAGISPTDSGILTTMDAGAATAAISTALNTAAANPLSAALSQSDAYGTSIIQQTQAEINRYQGMISDPSTDPAAAILFQKQAAIEQQYGQTVTQIQSQTDQQLQAQAKTNAQLEGQARAATNAAGAIGSITGEGYIAAQIQNNQAALTSITTAEQQMMIQAQQSLQNGEIDIAGQLVQEIQSNRDKAMSLSMQQYQLYGDMETRQQNRQQIALQTQSQMMQMKSQGMTLASDYLATYAKGNISPDVIPPEVWQTAVSDSGGTIDVNTAKAMYTGSLKDQQATSAAAFNQNTAALYQTAASITDPNAILMRPNQDGTFTSIKRAAVQLAPNYTTMNQTVNGRNQLLYIDPKNPTAPPIIQDLGPAQPNWTQVSDPNNGNIWQVDQNNPSNRQLLLDASGNTNVGTAVINTQNSVNNQGSPVTDNSNPDAIQGMYPNVPPTHPPGTPRQPGESLTDYTNNPGAITFAYAGSPNTPTGIIPALQAAGIQVKAGPRDANGNVVAMFNSVTDGYKARAVLMQTPTYANLDLAHAMGTYSGGKDSSGENKGYASYISQRTGIPVTGTTMSSLTDQQRFDMSQAQYEWESGHRQSGVMEPPEGPQLPQDNKAAWKINAPAGTDIKTGIKSGTVTALDQVGQYRDSSPMYQATIIDHQTQTQHIVNGIAASDLSVGMGWDASTKAPSIGTSGAGGYSVDLCNGNGNPIQPTQQSQPQQPGLAGQVANGQSWGTIDLPHLTTSPIRQTFEQDLKSITGGQVTDKEQALQMLKQDLPNVRPESYMPLLDGELSYGQTILSTKQDLDAQKQQAIKRQKVMTAQGILNTIPDYKVQQAPGGIISRAVQAETYYNDLNAGYNSRDDAMFLDAATKYTNSGGTITDSQMNLIKDVSTPWDAASVAKQKAEGIRSFLSPGQRDQVMGAIKESMNTTLGEYNDYTSSLQQDLAKNGSDFQIPSSPLALKVQMETASQPQSAQGTSPDFAALQAGAQPGEVLVTDNATGQSGYVPQTEYDPSLYTMVTQ